MKLDAITKAPGWSRAKCSHLDQATRDKEFFPQSNSKVPAYAKALCDACPEQPDCLEYALSMPDLFGVWAGTNRRQRNHIRKTRDTQTGETPTLWPNPAGTVLAFKATRPPCPTKLHEMARERITWTQLRIPFAARFTDAHVESLDVPKDWVTDLEQSYREATQ